MLSLFFKVANPSEIATQIADDAKIHKADKESEAFYKGLDGNLKLYLSGDGVEIFTPCLRLLPGMDRGVTPQDLDIADPTKRRRLPITADNEATQAIDLYRLFYPSFPGFRGNCRTDPCHDSKNEGERSMQDSGYEGMVPI